MVAPPSPDASQASSSSQIRLARICTITRKRG